MFNKGYLFAEMSPEKVTTHRLIFAICPKILLKVKS